MQYEPLCADDNREDGHSHTNTKADVYVDDDNGEVSDEEEDLKQSKRHVAYCTD